MAATPEKASHNEEIDSEAKTVSRRASEEPTAEGASHETASENRELDIDNAGKEVSLEATGEPTAEGAVAEDNQVCIQATLFSKVVLV